MARESTKDLMGISIRETGLSIWQMVREKR
jgi:hypothetical protein